MSEEPKQSRKYSREFKNDAVAKMQTCGSVSELARQLGVRRKFLYAWREQMALRGAVVPPLDRPPKEVSTAMLEGRRLLELERLVAKQAEELDFFRGALQRVDALRRKSGSGATASTTKSASECSGKAE